MAMKYPQGRVWCYPFAASREALREFAAAWENAIRAKTGKIILYGSLQYNETEA